MSATETVTRQATELVDHLFQISRDARSVAPAYANTHRGANRPKVARVAWRMALERRTELTDREWNRLREQFSWYCFRERSWNDLSRDIAPAIAEFPPSYHMEEQALADMLELTRTQLAEEDPNPENLLAFAYEIDPLDVYLADEVPNKMVAEFIASHPLTDSELLAQAAEELPAHFLLFTKHPNFPSDAVPRTRYSTILQHLVSHNEGGRVFTELWEQDCYDWDKIDASIRHDYEYGNIYRALGAHAQEDTLREVLSHVEIGDARSLLDGVLRRPAPLNDLSILAALLQKSAQQIMERYGQLRYLYVSEFWAELLSHRDIFSIAEFDLLLRFGTDALNSKEKVAGWLVDDGVLKVPTLSNPEKAFKRLLSKYPAEAVAAIPDFSDVLISEDL